jgi:hypothetical protein
MLQVSALTDLNMIPRGSMDVVSRRRRASCPAPSALVPDPESISYSLCCCRRRGLAQPARLGWPAVWAGLGWLAEPVFAGTVLMLQFGYRRRAQTRGYFRPIILYHVVVVVVRCAWASISRVVDPQDPRRC